MTDNPTADSPFGSAPIDPFQAAKASALKAAEELRSAAAQKASELRGAAEQRAQQWKQSAAADIKEKADEFRQYAGDTFEEARARCADLRVEAEKFAREKPVQALATAFGIGFVLGLLMRR